MPGKNKGGTYDVAACKKWVADNIQKRGDRGPLGQQKVKEEIGKLREEKLTKRLKRMQMKRRLRDAKEVEQNASELCLRIKHRLEQVPDEMEMSFPVETRADNKRELANKIENILREMAQWEI